MSSKWIVKYIATKRVCVFFEIKMDCKKMQKAQPNGLIVEFRENEMTKSVGKRKERENV